MTTPSAPITTTLQAIRDHGPCEDGWKKLIKHLGGVNRVDMNAQLPLDTVLTSNGLTDTIWCCRALDADTRKRLLCLWLADVLEHAAAKHPNTWLTDAVTLIREYQAGRATREAVRIFQLAAADAAAYAAYAATAHAADADAAVAYAVNAAAAAMRAWQTERLGQYLRGEV